MSHHQSPSAGEPKTGPYTPTLILHGGAGSITRAKLPQNLYQQYATALLTYLGSAHAQLRTGGSALDAAVHAVSRMEDDELFNCGRGAVFNERGIIEMEASVMVASVRHNAGVERGVEGGGPAVPVKRGAGVSLVRNTRHPIQLVRAVLLDGGNGLGSVGSMHCQLSGREVEEWGWRERGLEWKEEGWFWTRKRWREHERGLGRETLKGGVGEKKGEEEDDDELDLPSQGTVGCVAMDSWGELAVATSTGGLTNKRAGRLGDTPTLGAGFWAESWGGEGVVQSGSGPRPVPTSWSERIVRAAEAGFGDLLGDCLPRSQGLYQPVTDRVSTEQLPQVDMKYGAYQSPAAPQGQGSLNPSHSLPRRAVALSGTGNGDSFLRMAAVRTAAAMARFGSSPSSIVSLATAVSAIAGPGGELQQSAGDRWGKAFEGQGGIIGIVASSDQKAGQVVFDFNCGGMWHAWLDNETGKPRVMVFHDEYKE